MLIISAILLLNTLCTHYYVKFNGTFYPDTRKELCDVKLDAYSCNLIYTCKSVSPTLTCYPDNDSYCSDESKKNPFTEEIYVNYNNRTCHLYSPNIIPFVIVCLTNLIFLCALFSCIEKYNAERRLIYSQHLNNIAQTSV